MIRIDGTTYNIPVKSLRMKGEFLDKYAKRTANGDLQRELIGTYFNYEIQFGRTSMSDYAAIWQKLTEPEEFHEVTVPDEDGEFTFTAYFANIGAELVKVKEGTPYWKDLTVNFIAKTPART